MWWLVRCIKKRTKIVARVREHDCADDVHDGDVADDDRPRPHLGSRRGVRAPLGRTLSRPGRALARRADGNAS